MDPKTKYKLFKQSKNFCVVPWTNFELYTNGNVKTCSVGHTNMGNINDGNNAEKLFIKTAYVDEGPVMKRFRPAAMGRATAIKKRTSHLTIIISDKKG